jgi:hypothetical protein
MEKDEIENNAKSTLEEITRTVLYEGYAIFPYRRSSAKNVKPIPFGTVYPQAYQKHHSELHAAAQTQCILQSSDQASVKITLRFLHLCRKRLLRIDHENLGQNQFQSTDIIEIDNKTYESGWEAQERKIDIGAHTISNLINEPCKKPIQFEGEQANDIIYDEDGKVSCNVLFQQNEINGEVSVTVKPAGVVEDGYMITVKVANTTSVDDAAGCSRDEVYGQSFLSANTILESDRGTFISQADPPQEWKEVNETCENINTWPVLVDKDDKTMLSSPIVLYDYPEIAPESRGINFDSTEIEEMLMLQVAALTDEEKQEVEQSDGKMKAMLERVRSTTPEELLKLHGGFKDIETRMNECNKDSKI